MDAKTHTMIVMHKMINDLESGIADLRAENARLMERVDIILKRNKEIQCGTAIRNQLVKYTEWIDAVLAKGDE